LASYQFLPQATSTSSTQTTAPSWQPQVGALTQAFGGAQNAYAKQLGMGDYNGDYIAAPNATQYGAIDQATNFAQGNAANVGNTQINQGQGLLSNYGTGTNAANALYNFGSASQTQNALNTANQFANNPYIDQMVNAATYGANRNAAENDVPNLYRSAAASGNINSDRAALAQGVIGRGLAENAQNIGATMRGNAWNTGLNQFNTMNQQQLGALSNAGQLGANLGGAGSSMMSQGINDQSNLSNLYSGAGSALNSLNQSFLDNSLAKYQGKIQNTWDPVNRLYGVAGANNWGSTQNTSSTGFSMAPQLNQSSSPGALGIAGAGLGIAGSLAGLSLGGPAGAAAGGTIGGALAKYMAPSVFGSASTPNPGGGVIRNGQVFPS
jgi:hypothetical protein